MSGTSAPTPFVIREYVRWSDVDYAGIIRYDAYLRFMAMAEAEMFRELGITSSQMEERFDFTVPRRAMHVDFESAPKLDELLEVQAYVSKVGTTSMTLQFDVYGGANADVMRATGYLVIVCVQRGTMRSRTWSPEFLSLISPRRLSVDAARAARTMGTQ